MVRSQPRSLNPEQARQRLREAAQRVEIGATLRKRVIPVMFAVGTAGLLLGRFPVIRKLAWGLLPIALKFVQSRRALKR